MRLASARSWPAVVALFLGFIFFVEAGCRPHVRLGDIEPPEGQRVLVDARIRPVDPAPWSRRAAGAIGDVTAADVAFARVPVIGSSTILNEMASPVQSADVSAARARVEPSELGVDARRIESIYAARGYFRARTLSFSTTDLDDIRSRVTYDVTEGEPTRVVRLDFEGLELPEDDAESAELLIGLWARLDDLVFLKVGDIWDETAYLRGLGAIRRAFRDAGYIDAEVTGDTFVSQDLPQAAVRYRISHGLLVRASGRLRVIGEKIVPAERILRRAELERGAILRAEDLRDAEQRIFELGQFLFVQVRPMSGSGRPPGEGRQGRGEGGSRQGAGRREASPDAGEADSEAPPTEASSEAAPPEVEPETVMAASDDAEPEVTQPPPPRRRVLVPGYSRVEIEVQEAPEWDVNVGFGARTDSTQLSLEVPFGFNHRDLFGELVTLRTEARPALVFPEAFQTSSLAGVRFGMNARAILSVPSFFEEYTKFNITTNYRRDVTQATPVEEFSGSLDWSRRLGRYLSARVGWNFSYSNFIDRSIFDILAPPEALDALSLRFRPTDFLAWVGVSFIFDSRDGIFEARRGFFASLTFDMGDTWTGSLAPFERLTFEGRTYLTHPEFDLITLALRIRTGAVFHRDSVGTNESARLRSGGQNSMRGFAANRMGNYICIRGTEPGQAINGGCSGSILDRLYVGGNYLIEGNAEVRLNLGTLGLVGFIDVGQVWNTASEVDLRALHVAVGPGLRVQTPIGPLRADLGFLLGPVPRTEFHVGLGQAF